ncbi:MAG: hypothetical protein KKD18_03710 [Nanoarchaeota archaeon]|nr:hypothetical protein [Nanoarchaeota archaeon]MBU0977497.1 hypothetical protein [Nanoarchaeota archaeon]
MTIVYETKNFIIEAVEKPHVTREDGGHLKILPKKEFADRTELSPELAVEFIRLTLIVGRAMKTGMTNRGIEISRINYQDMGNWAFKKNEKPYFHMHIYGRSKDAKYQPYTEAVRLPDRASGFYDNFKPLNTKDIEEIQKQIKLILQEDKYKDPNWKLQT